MVKVTGGSGSPSGVMASLRYVKRERSPVSTREQDVRLFPGERRWDAGGGRAGRAGPPVRRTP